MGFLLPAFVLPLIFSTTVPDCPCQKRFGAYFYESCTKSCITAIAGKLSLGNTWIFPSLNYVFFSITDHSQLEKLADEVWYPHLQKRVPHSAYMSVCFIDCVHVCVGTRVNTRKAHVHIEHTHKSHSTNTQHACTQTHAPWPLSFLSHTFVQYMALQPSVKAIFCDATFCPANFDPVGMRSFKFAVLSYSKCPCVVRFAGLTVKLTRMDVLCQAGILIAKNILPRLEPICVSWVGLCDTDALTIVSTLSGHEKI